MSSVIQICNVALSKVGDEPITKITEDNKRASFCNLLYEPTRDGMLVEHNWAFARARAELPQLASTPLFEWAYQYSLPGDSLRAIELYGTTATWVREGQNILTDLDDDVCLKYIRKVTDPTQFDEYFVQAFEAKLAIALCEPLAKDDTLKQILMAEYIAVMAMAKQLNAVENLNGPEENTDTNWQSEGH